MEVDHHIKLYEELVELLEKDFRLAKDNEPRRNEIIKELNDNSYYPRWWLQTQLRDGDVRVD